MQKPSDEFKQKELGTGLVNAIKKDLGLK